MLGFRLRQGQTEQSDRGYYTTDQMHLVVSGDMARDVIRDIIADPDAHLDDIFKYRKQLWTPTSILPIGAIGSYFAVVPIDAIEFKIDQQVRDVIPDPTF